MSNCVRLPHAATGKNSGDLSGRSGMSLHRYNLPKTAKAGAKGGGPTPETPPTAPPSEGAAFPSVPDTRPCLLHWLPEAPSPAVRSSIRRPESPSSPPKTTPPPAGRQGALIVAGGLPVRFDEGREWADYSRSAPVYSTVFTPIRSKICVYVGLRRQICPSARADRNGTHEASTRPSGEEFNRTRS